MFEVLSTPHEHMHYVLSGVLVPSYHQHSLKLNHDGNFYKSLIVLSRIVPTYLPLLQAGLYRSSGYWWLG